MRKRKCKSCGKLFTPEYDTKTVRQMVCSNSCCVLYYDKHKPKSRKLAKEIAKMVGKRSMGEVRFDASFIEGKKGITSYYEPDKFPYRVEKTCVYTPDFKIKPYRKKAFYVEYKGVLDVDARNKMKLVKQQYPKLDIRFVFQRANNKIQKNSKTTYGMWADQWGFPWADNCIPKEWLL